METTPLRTFIGLVPQILVEISIGNFFQRLDLVDGNQVRVEVHELDADLLEGPLRQQVPFHARQGLVRVVVRLFDEPELLPLILVQSTINPVVLLQPLQSQYK